MLSGCKVIPALGSGQCALPELTRSDFAHVGRHAAVEPVTVTTARHDRHMGRKSMGERELLGTRPNDELAKAARRRVAELEMASMSDYLALLIARDVDRLDIAPRPKATDTRQELPISA